MAKPQLPRDLHLLLALVSLAALSLVVVLVTRGCHNNEVRDVNVPINLTIGK